METRERNKISAHIGIERLGELSFDGVFMFDLKSSQFLYVNDAFGRLINLGKERLMREPADLLTYISTEDSDYVKQEFQQLLQTHAVKDAEFRISLLDGTMRHLLCDAFHFQDEQILYGIVKDISKEREHQDYIINYGAKKDTLLDMMTHNLSGPLHLSKNILSWMQKNTIDTSSNDISAQLKMIQENTQECLEIVNDFLKEEHLASENIYIKKTRFDVLKRITSTLDKLIATNKQKKFRIISKVENLNINTDSVKFFQIIHNLVSNSIKFTPENGEIDIIVEETDKSFIVRVRDNGIGIPPKLRENLFDTRNLSGRTGLKNESSNGIGLSIVKKLVELLDGNVSFETEENKGTVFSVELPKD